MTNEGTTHKERYIIAKALMETLSNDYDEVATQPGITDEHLMDHPFWDAQEHYWNVRTEFAVWAIDQMTKVAKENGIKVSKRDQENIEFTKTRCNRADVANKIIKIALQWEGTN